MTINIPKNDYVVPTEAREEIVQAICNAFLSPCDQDSEFHIGSRLKTYGIHIESPKKAEFVSKYSNHYLNEIHIRTVEMKEAFKALIDAGYYMFKKSFEDGYYYKASKKPYEDRAIRITSFNEFID